ncbi:MAG: hypothetical protein WCD56_03185 [Pseudolabrys sp.]
MALLIVPSLVGQLLLGEVLTGVAIPVARVAGIALIALGIACWPGPPLVGMLTYSAVVTLYLAYLGFAGGLTGVFFYGPQLRFTQCCQSFSVALGSPLRRDKGAADFRSGPTLKNTKRTIRPHRRFCPLLE